MSFTISLQPNVVKMNNQSSHENSDKDKTAPLEEEITAEQVSGEDFEPTRSSTLVIQGGKGRSRRSAEAEGEGAAVLNGSRLIELVIRGMVEPVDFTNRDSLTVGRSDHKKAALPDIDLAKYGAAQWGVSREHVRMEIRNDQLFLTDLGSTNGTLLRGERITAFTPYPVHSQDEITLGRMTLQVVFA